MALAISQSIFLNLVVSRLTKIVPNLDHQTIIDQGIVSLPNAPLDQYRNAVYQAYAKTIVDVFYVGLTCACVTICSVGIEWRSVKEKKKESRTVLDNDNNAQAADS